MSKNTSAINSDVVGRLHNMFGVKNILDLEVRGKWLIAYLASGCKFWVLNK